MAHYARNCIKRDCIKEVLLYFYFNDFSPASRTGIISPCRQHKKYIYFFSYSFHYSPGVVTKVELVTYSMEKTSACLARAGSNFISISSVEGVMAPSDLSFESTEIYHHVIQ